MVKRFMVCVLVGTCSLNAMDYPEIHHVDDGLSQVVDVKVKLLLINRAFTLQEHPEMIHETYRNVTLSDLKKQQENLQGALERLKVPLTDKEQAEVDHRANQRAWFALRDSIGTRGTETIHELQ